MYGKYRPFLLAKLVLVVMLGITGCASMNQFDPFGASDYRDSTQDTQDEWSFVGKEGRGDSALIDENDPFKPFLMSPKARSIERNLGFK